MNIAVIGGGWAGCAAAVELSANGRRVTLFESARVLGGRARALEVEGKQLDNGQHILLGAYSETLRLMHMLGIDQRQACLRLPLQIRYPAADGGFEFVAARLPAPLHLVTALLRTRQLQRADKLALARFASTARWMDWRLDADCTVIEFLQRLNQTPALFRYLWRPLCIAALNTPPERASARVFLKVMGDSLGARRAASDMLIPKQDLTALFPRQAERFIKHSGGEVRAGVSVSRLRRSDSRWHLDCRGAHDTQTGFDAVVLAIQPSAAIPLLEGIADTEVLRGFQYEPITTCYLQYPGHVSLQQPLFALMDDAAVGDWGQFVFDRGCLDAKDAGLLAVVVSASTASFGLQRDALGQAIARQLARAFGRPELATPDWTRVITEKRATFSCTPNLRRPDNATGVESLVLAGDYTASDYPATLETAVRSGMRAARLLTT